MIKRYYIPVLLLLLISITNINGAKGQSHITVDGYTVLPVTILNGDTLPNVLIQEVAVFPKRIFRSNREYRQYQRMIRNLKIVYPYAKLAQQKLSDMDAHLKTLKTEKERKDYINKAEKELRAEFEPKLVKLTISQGRLLIKLIDRQAGKTTYQVLRELKGSAPAFFWQTVARVFGSNLKSEFDTEGEDKMLNELIVLYEHGQL
ncbi:MAG: DUF4294 domain-containing protein [Bacteroidales bacterium]|nr:DUF4294 domain-containing protein [Bacteroidales bacterium]MBN2750638.1 DUF4294 domain-containing protein [Bacteroidales bacterium]